jgi:hypothetical protein
MESKILLAEKVWSSLSINSKLEMETKSIYQRLDNKLHNLTQQQTNCPSTHHTFYPRIVNNTDITFSSKEIGLLGPQVQPAPQKEKLAHKPRPRSRNSHFPVTYNRPGIP